jgi:hypothetical protein
MFIVPWFSTTFRGLYNSALLPSLMPYYWMLLLTNPKFHSTFSHFVANCTQIHSSFCGIFKKLLMPTLNQIMVVTEQQNMSRLKGKNNRIQRTKPCPIITHLSHDFRERFRVQFENFCDRHSVRWDFFFWIPLLKMRGCKSKYVLQTGQTFLYLLWQGEQWILHSCYKVCVYIYIFHIYIYKGLRTAKPWR